MEFHVTSPEGTRQLAALLAPMLAPSDVLLLGGTLGAGKTAMAQALIRALLGEGAEVTSPTFTLQHPYDLPDGGQLVHMDLYRIEHENELYELGLDDTFDTAISLIEWPERLGSFTPKECLYLRIEIAQDEARIITLKATQAWQARLQDLEHAINRQKSPYVTFR